MRCQVSYRRGAEVHRGSLEILKAWRSGAAAFGRRDPHGFHHDFSKFAENCEMDKRAIEALGVALEGSERPLLVTSGLATVAQGRMLQKKMLLFLPLPRIRAPRKDG